VLSCIGSLADTKSVEQVPQLIYRPSPNGQQRLNGVLVLLSSLATVYALSATGDEAVLALSPLIASQWSLPTALSLLAWFVFAPQCFSTLAVVKRETGGYLMPVAMAAYLFGLAYLAAFVTYKIAFAVML
jgi:ferrous iron transport protein B